MPISFRQRCGHAALTMLVACFLCSCGGDQKEASKPPVVSKKIAVPAQPAAATIPGSNRSQVQPPQAEAPPVETKSTADTEHRIYDPEKRVNPFIPLFKAKPENTPAETQMAKKKSRKRIPQTPLERISLSQLKLVAIIRAPSGNRALVEDSSGKGYIIKQGTYIGLNAGIVTQINSDSVVVEEEKENLMGELVLQNTEMKLQKPTGE